MMTLFEADSPEPTPTEAVETSQGRIIIHDPDSDTAWLWCDGDWFLNPEELRTGGARP